MSWKTGLCTVVSTAALALCGVFPAPLWAAPEDLYVQVNLFGATEGCSILRVEPAGDLSEWVSNAQILAATGEPVADCDDTGLAVTADGTIYFIDDVSDALLEVSPAGQVSLFAEEAVLGAASGAFASDIDSGLIVGSDGNLYAADDVCDCVLRVTRPGGVVSVVVTEAAIAAVTGAAGADLEGGIARDAAGNLYITEDDTDSVLVLPPGGPLAMLTPESAITAATGNAAADLDVGVELDGSLFVLDDGAGEIASVLEIDVATGGVSVLAQAPAIQAATGVVNLSPAAAVDLEGGIAARVGGDLFLGDDGTEEAVGAPPVERANIVRVTRVGAVSVFVSDAELQAFYGALYPGSIARLQGSMDLQPGTSAVIPTLGEWGLAALAAALALLGTAVLRRRTAGNHP